MVDGSMYERICSHRIEYWWDDREERELDECNIEHIQNLLIENYVQGELCQCDEIGEIEYYGWWRIEN